MLDKVLNAYIECALWSSSDDDDTPLDSNYDIDDIAPETLQRMSDDCLAFIVQNGDLLVGMDPGQVGHDFWLTRNGHGAGFWDRGLGERGKKLTVSAESFGETDLYIGDDGKVYAQ